MDKLKTYFIEVVLKNVSPKVVASIISMAIAFMAAHQDMMERMGITYYPNFNGHWSGAAPTGQLVVVEIETLQVWGALMLVGGITAIWALVSHHAAATITGARQFGDVRTNPDVPVAGGARAKDTQRETQ